MAFTLHLDEGTEELLKKIKVEIRAKTKNQAIRSLIHNYQYQKDLQKAYSSLKQENRVLMDVNFISKLLALCERRLNKEV